MLGATLACLSAAELTPGEQAALDSNPVLKEQFLQLARAQQLLLNEARKARWEERDEVRLALARARDKTLAESWLKSIAEPPPEYPSEVELSAAWEARKAAFAAPRQHRLAQIFIACPPGTDKAAVVKAEAKLSAIRRRLASPKEDFATVARDASDDSVTAASGGEIGWLTDGQIQPELRAPVCRLLPHEISPPLRLADGWHILKCLEKREARTPSLAELRPELVKQLRDEKAKANSEAYVAGLLRASISAPDDSALNGPVPVPPK